MKSGTDFAKPWIYGPTLENNTSHEVSLRTDFWPFEDPEKSLDFYREKMGMKPLAWICLDLNESEC